MIYLTRRLFGTVTQKSKASAVEESITVAVEICTKKVIVHLTVTVASMLNRLHLCT